MVSSWGAPTLPLLCDHSRIQNTHKESQRMKHNCLPSQIPSVRNYNHGTIGLLVAHSYQAQTYSIGGHLTDHKFLYKPIPILLLEKDFSFKLESTISFTPSQSASSFEPEFQLSLFPKRKMTNRLRQITRTLMFWNLSSQKYKLRAHLQAWPSTMPLHCNIHQSTGRCHKKHKQASSLTLY